MPLINCKVYLEQTWIEDYILSSAGNTAKFTIADSKVYKFDTNLAKQLKDGFNRSFCWNSYETKPEKLIEQGKNI